MVLSHSAGGMSSMGAQTPLMPALAMTMSSRPACCSRASTATRIWASSAISVGGRAMALPPDSAMDAATAATRSARISSRPTVAPPPASSRAVASPTPEPPPVTSATRPAKSNSFPPSSRHDTLRLTCGPAPKRAIVNSVVAPGRTKSMKGANDWILEGIDEDRDVPVSGNRRQMALRAANGRDGGRCARRRRADLGVPAGGAAGEEVPGLRLQRLDLRRLAADGPHQARHRGSRGGDGAVHRSDPQSRRARGQMLLLLVDGEVFVDPHQLLQADARRGADHRL